MTLRKRALLLFKAKRYTELHILLLKNPQVGEELSKTHRDFSKWFWKEDAKRWNEAFKSPESESFYRDFCYKLGPEYAMYFEIKRSLHKVGFATVQDIAACLGLEQAAVKAALKNNLALFGFEIVDEQISQ